MSVRLGVSPIGWSNDDLHELGGDTPLDTCLAEARRAGFAGIELGHKFPSDPAVLRPILDGHGLALISGWYSGRLLDRSVEQELAAIEAHRALLVAMGCAVLVYAETSGGVAGDRRRGLSTRPRLRDEEWRDFGGRLTDLADRLTRGGIRLAYHHHMGTVVESEAEIDALMAATGPSVHLLLDTGHATFGGADPAALARRYRSRISHVHTKDVRADVMATAKAQRLSFLDAVISGVFTVPGDGCVDYPAVFRELPGYAGWVVVEAEQDPAKAHPLTYARLGYKNLRGYLTNAGLL